MQPLLSPKQVAQALRVSESSVKRWCDKGSINTTYTEGGHRRIRMADLADFVRNNSLAIQDFVPMGLATSNPPVGALQEAAPIMADALLAGDEDHCSQIVMELFLAKHSVHQICDQVIAEAFKRIGHRWACGEAEIYQERRGCKIAQRILNRLHYLISDIASSAPLAIGCSVEGDYYSLGSTMVELVFRESGWRAMSLGENIPISSLEKAIGKQKPQAVWLSCSYISDPKQFVESYRALRDKHQSALFILGGMALKEEIVQQIECSFNGSCMKELFEYATKKKLDFA
jgi:MerR family transcriptional regulator, light-induced transcriptional regulator